MDARDKPTWVALELTKAGEQKAIDGSLSASLRSELGVSESHPIFVPYASYAKGGRRVSVRLIEGYSFVASGLTETRYFALERGPLVSKVMSTPGPHNLRTLQTVPDEKIRGMMAQLRSQVASDIEIGERVRVIGGNYLHLEGTVVDMTEDKVAVRITLRSIDIVAWMSKILVDSASNVVEDTGSEIDPLDLAVGVDLLPED